MPRSEEELPATIFERFGTAFVFVAFILDGLFVCWFVCGLRRTHGVSPVRKPTWAFSLLGIRIVVAGGVSTQTTAPSFGPPEDTVERHRPEAVACFHHWRREMQLARGGARRS